MALRRTRTRTKTRTRDGHPSALALVFVLVFVLSPFASAARTSWHDDDGIAIANALLQDPAIREAADSRAPVALRIEIVDGATADLLYDGAVRNGSARDPYEIRMTTDAALAILNHPDPEAGIRCLVAHGAIAIVPPSATERIAINAAHDGAARGVTCAPPEGARMISPGLFKLGDRVYDAFGSALGWQDPDAARVLGRADAGISRLQPDEIPRGAPADLRDPWRAAAAPEIRALMNASADCPCDAPRALVPAGDWRAQLAADPRAHGGAG